MTTFPGTIGEMSSTLALERVLSSKKIALEQKQHLLQELESFVRNPHLMQVSERLLPTPDNHFLCDTDGFIDNFNVFYSRVATANVKGDILGKLHYLLLSQNIPRSIDYCIIGGRHSDPTTAYMLEYAFQLA
jgi:hypothetical protein